MRNSDSSVDAHLLSGQNVRVKGMQAAVVAALLFVLGTAMFAQRGGGQPGVPGQQQAGQATEEPGRITGQVVSATTGEPLRKVSLTLQNRGRGGTTAVATSDNSGSFDFPSVVPGNYRLTGDRTGFVQEIYGMDQPGSQPRDIEVTAGSTTSGLVFKLTPHSVITGRVFDEDGDPLENAQVRAMQYTYPRGERQLNTVANTSTNDLGEFRLSGLAPGRYYLSAGQNRQNQRRLLNILDDSPQELEEAYVQTFYPRVTDPRSATPIDLIAGSEVQGIDIGLSKSPMYEVSGVIQGMPGADTPLPALDLLDQFIGRGGRGGGKGKGKGLNVESVAGIPVEDIRDRLRAFSNVAVTLTPREIGAFNVNNVIAGGQVDNATGEFNFAAVPPGAYYLVAQTRGRGNDQQLSARIPVDVTSGNLGNLRVELSPPLLVGGTLSVDSQNAELDYNAVRLNFRSLMPAGPRQQGRTEIFEDGTFNTELAPDTYAIEMGGLPEGYYLKAARLAGRELPDAVLDLNFAGGQLQVEIGTDAGSISGRVQNSRGEPIESARVTVVPATESRRNDLYKSATTAEDGTFTVSGVPPGEYEVYAWEEVETNAWMDTLYRQPFQALAEDVEVEPGLAANATLDVIERSQTLAINGR